MFLYIAESYDGILRTRLKQLTALIEPITIAMIAIMVALVAVSIALAMVTTYKYIDQ
jgi:type II secretory pathway component PulF